MVAMMIPDWLVSKTGDDSPLPPGLRMSVDDNGPAFIYCLVDPETDEIRYIGKSIRPEERLMNHMNERSRCHRTHWLQSLKRRGLRPIQIILEIIDGGWPWQESERYWIAYGKRAGWPLTNGTDGGDGVPGLSGESKERMARTWVGRKHSDETKRKIGEKSRSRRHTAATRQKMSEAHSGRVIAWADKISQSLCKLTDSQIAEILDALAKGETVTSLAVKYGVHRTTLSKVKAGTYRRDFDGA